MLGLAILSTSAWGWGRHREVDIVQERVPKLQCRPLNVHGRKAIKGDVWTRYAIRGTPHTFTIPPSPYCATKVTVLLSEEA